jgi:excisionase family DNA binding protein
MEAIVNDTATNTPVLTAKEVAERLQLSERWVAEQARAGRIPSVRLGRAMRFTEAQVVEIIASGDRPVQEPTEPRGLRRRVRRRADRTKSGRCE